MAASIRNCDEFNSVINNGRVVVIDFYSDGSKLLAPQLVDFSETFKLLGVDLYSVNIDEVDDVVLQVDVRVVPTLMVFKDGKNVGQSEGVGAGNLHKLMRSHIAEWTASKMIQP